MKRGNVISNSRDNALRVNAATPFSKSFNPKATPFQASSPLSVKPISVANAPIRSTPIKRTITESDHDVGVKKSSIWSFVMDSLFGW